jgi:hypothetical protein
MPEGQIDVTLKFDSDTRQLNVVQSELGKVSQKTGELPGKIKNATKETNKLGGAFKGIGSALGAIGLGAFLFDAARRAVMASDSMDELNTTWSETIGLLSNELEPAIQFVTRGLMGMMAVMVGLVRFIKENLVGAWEALSLALSGDIPAALETAKKAFSDGTNALLDQMLVAGERAQGISRASQAAQAKILVDANIAKLKNDRNTGEEKLRILDETETQALEILRASGEFQAANRTQQQKMELDIIKAIASERQSAQAQAFSEQEAALAAELNLLNTRAAAVGNSWAERLELARQANEIELEIIEVQGEKTLATEETMRQRRQAQAAAFAEQVNAIEREERLARHEAERASTNEHYEIMLEDQFLTREERLAILEEFEQAELDSIDEMNELKGLSEFESNQNRLNTQRQFAGQRRNMMNQERQERTQFFNTMIQAGAQAAAQELATSRNAGRAARAALAEGVESATSAASRMIVVKGAQATASSFANAGGYPAGIVTAAATAAFYAVLAGTVSAGGSALANALRPPPIPDPAPEAAPPTITTAPITSATVADVGAEVREGRARDRAVRTRARTVSRGTDQKVGEAPGAKAGEGMTVIFNVSSLDGRMSPEALDTVLKAVSRAQRGEGKKRR